MPRGGHKVKPVKASQPDASANLRVPGVSLSTQSTRAPHISPPTVLSRNSSEPTLPDSVSDQPSSQRDVSRSRNGVAHLPVDSASSRPPSICVESRDTSPSGLSADLECPRRPTSIRTSSSRSTGPEDTYDAALDTLEELTIYETQSSASSVYSRDSSSIYSSASSIYSSASSIYSSGASVYSVDECASEELDRYSSRGSHEVQHQHRARPVSVRRQEAPDAASREASALARKCALYKNSQLSPHLPLFETSLPAWAMICRAAQASLDCYDSQSSSRRGTYIPANTSKDIKAMIVDDQHIDESRLIIVAIRGTKCQSLTDWAVNKAANPTKPVGFLDDEDNACHEGFLQVTKAMVSQVAAQLQQHPASSERPSLLFTGHSAGGAVAAMLYSHMLSTSVHSDLTVLADRFPTISCVTFGAPPLTLTPLKRRPHRSGVFLAFANEGDPILRVSNAAYVKSLAKLLTASAPPTPGTTAAAPPPAVKVIRGSRGGTVYRQVLTPASSTPWEELPLWPTPPGALTNAGEVVLLRDQENGCATASQVNSDDMSEVIFGDLAQHTIGVYLRRVKELALAAMLGGA